LRQKGFEVHGYSREELNITNEGEVQRVISAISQKQ
jgi:hypothetical protein